jgi:CHAD domain-containing protein
MFMTYCNFIFTHWKKEQRVASDNLALLKQHHDKNAVHDLRIAIKNLRAALKLYILITEEPFWQYPLKKTEELFNILGKQRDIEICLETLATLEKETAKKYTELKYHFQSLLIVAYKWTTKTVREYKKKELAAIALLLKDERQFFVPEELEYKIPGIINNHLADCRNYYKQPHKLRQYLKEIYYWIKMIPKAIFVQVEYEKRLHEILEDFGNWQDLQMFEIKIKHFRKDYLPKVFHEYDSIKMLKNSVTEKKAILLKTALNKTRRLIRKVTSPKKEKSEA